MSISDVRDPATALIIPSYPGAQLRRISNVGRDRLAPAIHTAMQVASALVRTLGVNSSTVQLPPSDGIAWRQEIQHASAAIKLDDMLVDLWNRGIPVVPLTQLPVPSFQGMVCIVENRPVILVCYKHDEPGRIAFLISHEVGHIVAGDCTADHPVVDEEDEVADNTAMELAAERFATRVLVGGDAIPQVNADSYRDLATKAIQIEKTSGSDAGTVIFGWARRTLDYTAATMAAKALYRASGARRLMSEQFASRVDMSLATESDRNLLRCVMEGS